jgi:3-methylcrotonyl-CoA carboxylase alpha subunit
MFKTILIANRGEIACRIIKTAQRMGIETVAVYSAADRESLHVQRADRALYIGEAVVHESYLNIDAIIKAAIASGAEAIHPGYGFLSENPEFAQACANAKIVFIGPSIDAMELMASKQKAKQCLEKKGLALTPGYHGLDQSDKKLLQEAETIGFPVLLKAAMGGGGKGMRLVQKKADFYTELQATRREAKAYFADETVLIEKYIEHPRHIEVQIMADHHGNTLHIFERDCSIQRRHQKIIEEAPAANLSPKLRQKITEAAILVAQAINYHGAGTIEFLLDKHEQFYFMEMNTRLQVEHPVTEAVTGLDLVEWQLRIAAGEPLPPQEQIKLQGHAIECRIYAEDPLEQFLPSVGKIRFLKEPQGEGLRLDTGIALGSSISPYYDPMMAKLIAYGETREQAIHRMLAALKHYAIGGVKSNLSFLQAIIQAPQFMAADLSTDFLKEYPILIPTVTVEEALSIAACFDYWQAQQTNDPLEQDTFAWHAQLTRQWPYHYLMGQDRHHVLVRPMGPQTLELEINEQTHYKLSFQCLDARFIIDNGQTRSTAWIENTADTLYVYTEKGSARLERFRWQTLGTAKNTQEHSLNAPMHGTIVAVLKNKGDKIKAGERLLIMEAMKMEHTICAPKDGVLMDVFYGVGAQVNEGTELVAIE